MKKDRARPPKTVVTALIALIVVGGVMMWKIGQSGQQHAAVGKAYAPAISSHAKGNPSAIVKIIEFTDFQCPACAFGAQSIAALLKKYPDRIYLEHKDFPLPMHPHAKRASIFAECAAEQGKFWPFHDVLFNSQQSWSKMTTVDGYFSQLAVSLGFDGIRLAACVSNVATSAKVEKDVAEGKKLGINSTPTFFVNGKMVVGANALTTEVDSLLGERR